MANPILKDNVFKFLSVRPPQTISTSRRSVHFAQYDDFQISPLNVAIAALNGQSDARNKSLKLAKDFLESNAYITNPEYPKEDAKSLLQIEEAVSRIDPQSDLRVVINTIETVTTKKITDFIKTDAFNKLRDGFWDSLYANTLIPYERPQDRDTIFNGIRLIHFLQFISNNEKLPEETKNWKELLNATPLLPKDLFPKPKQEAIKKDDSKENPEDPQKAKKEIKEKINSFNNALKDIKDANRKQLLDLSRQTRNIHDRDETVQRKSNKNIKLNTASDNQTKKLESTSKIVFSWGLGAGAKYLSANTQSVLAENNISLELLTVPEMITSLEMEMSKMSELLFRGIENNRIQQIGNVFVNTSRSRASMLTNIPPGTISTAPSPLFPVGNVPYPAVPGVTVLGIGDLMIVEQTLLKYQAGEVAHIENILKSENKERKHRRLNRTEESFLSANERTEETEKDLQSTERFELQRESQKTIQSDSKADAGVTVSGGFGPVTTTAHANFATNTSITESNRSATNYAKDITERTTSRIKEQVREERTRKTLEEIEEINIHGFDNKDGTDHVTGIYRWVDKIYQAQVINYGKRLMLEFIIPEPAAFYIHAENNKSIKGISLTEPIDPQTLGAIGGTVSGHFFPYDLHSRDYEWWVTQYQVHDVQPPPPEFLVIGISLEQPHNPEHSDLYTKANEALSIPEGYVAKNAIVHSSARGYIRILVGENAPHLLLSEFAGGAFTLSGESKVVPISILADADAYVVNIEVTCERLPETFKKWQLTTYTSILSAYQKLKSDYDEQLSAAKINQGVQIAGRNPVRNREIEQEELKKGCLTFLFTPGSANTAFDQFGAVIYPQPPPPPLANQYPEIDISEAVSEARFIQFLEQAFEWNQMTYLFYPYFWGRKSNWVDIYQLEDKDHLFTKFLQAGAARVLVPVRPNYDDALRHYLSTGEPWNGGNAPSINDELFISVADEIRAATGRNDDGIKVGDPWEVKIPTSLVYLDPLDSPLPDWSPVVTVP